MEYVDELIEKTKKRMTLKEGYDLEREILDFLNNENISEELKFKLRDESLLEQVSILSDGYKKENQLEHYSIY